MKEIDRTLLKLLKIMVFLFPFCYGLFYEWAACAAGLIFLGILLWMIKEEKTIRIPWNISFLLLGSIVFLYLLSTCYAIDRGMAILGFVKFFPLVLFFVIAVRLNDRERIDIIRVIPWSAFVMTLLSLCFYVTPWKKYFYRAERLGGFFQYSNTFALLLFVGIVILLFCETLTKLRLIMIAVLTMGILMTGSRSVFLLAVMAALAAGIQRLVLRYGRKKKEIRSSRSLILAAIVLGVISLSLILAVCTGNTQLFSRFTSIFTDSGTLVGRLLYYRDAVFMIARHPFGLGYMGYRYLCGSEQTGVYQIQYVHNDFLQAGLDIGVAGMILCIILFLTRICSRQTSGLQRALWMIIGIHACVDFDLQFLFIGFILVLCMDYRKVKTIKVIPGVCIPALIFCMCGFLWLLIPLAQEHLGYHREACRMYPYYTAARVNEMLQETDETVQNHLAENIIRQNLYCSDAYYVRAIYDVNHGDYDSMIQNQRQLIRLEKYQIKNYEQYIRMLSVALGAVLEDGEMEKGRKYIGYILEVPEMLEEVRKNTSKLAYKIKDKPELELDEVYQNYVNRLKNLQE